MEHRREKIRPPLHASAFGKVQFSLGQDFVNLKTLTTGLLALASCLWIAGSTPAAQSRSLAITHVSVIDATGSAPKRDQTVIVTGDRIVATDASNRVRVPIGAELLDGTGKFVIPGLWDMHVHLGAYEDGRKTLLRLLASGITGVRDMASPLDDILRLRQDAEAGTILSPRIVAAGPILQGPLPFRVPPLVRIVTEGDAKQTVDELRTRGVDFIKVGDTLTRDAYFAIAQESRRLGVPFVGHLTPHVTAFEAARAGQRSLEHFGSAGFRNVLVACSSEEADLDAYLRNALEVTRTGGESPDAKVYRADFTRRLVDSYDARKAATLFALFVKNGTWQVPTFVALRDVWTSAKSKLTPEEVAAGDRVSQKTVEMFAEMRGAGVKVLAGSDLTIRNGVPSLHEELVALVSVGMTSMAALQSATKNPAEFLGRNREEGTIGIGKKANLTVLDANPLEDIANTRRVAAVVLAGKLLRVSDIQKLN
jgi:imidazolonepropionase-like amidohydrolase